MPGIRDFDGCTSLATGDAIAIRLRMGVAARPGERYRARLHADTIHATEFDKGKLDTAQVRRRMSAGRLGSAWHTTDVMLFLASDGADFISGVTFPVDGGYMARGAMGDAYVGPFAETAGFRFIRRQSP